MTAQQQASRLLRELGLGATITVIQSAMLEVAKELRSKEHSDADAISAATLHEMAAHDLGCLMTHLRTRVRTIVTVTEKSNSAAEEDET